MPREPELDDPIALGKDEEETIDEPDQMYDDMYND